MPFLQSLSHLKPILPFHLHPKPIDFIPKLTRKNPRNAFPVLSCSATEQELLQAVLESDEKALPCVRTYETDLARLVLAGAVDLEQALTAAAATGVKPPPSTSIPACPLWSSRPSFPALRTSAAPSPPGWSVPFPCPSFKCYSNF
jgi:hypothetical protein